MSIAKLNGADASMIVLSSAEGSPKRAGGKANVMLQGVLAGPNTLPVPEL
jgi:hypothetical protein